MVILTAIFAAIAPYAVELIVDMLTAEKDPECDTGLKKHDYVMGQFADRTKNDPELAKFENRDVMDTLNTQIKTTVKELKKKGVFKKGA